jgi:hypothetical protein
MFCPSFGHNHMWQNKGKWGRNMFVGAANGLKCAGLFRGILNMEEVKITCWSKIHDFT